MDQRTLLLFRHAKSSWSDPGLDDFDRPLAPRGVAAAPLMANFIARKGLRPDFVLCSSARRAEETWLLLAEGLGGDFEIKMLRGLYLAAPSRILEALSRGPQNARTIMVVGHNPGLEHLAHAMAGSGSNQKAVKRLREKFPTAALAQIDLEAASWRDVVVGEGRLVRLVRPKDLS